MPIIRDIDRVIEQVKNRLPLVQVRQHQVNRPGVDDDGLWWFSLPEVEKDIQIESSDGTCPFLIEHDDMKTSSEAEIAQTVDEVVCIVVSYLARQIVP